MKTKRVFRTFRQKVLIALSLPLLALSLTPPAFANLIQDTKHNLSAQGPGTIKATSGKRLCVFCHTPHHATGPLLWNRDDPTSTYIPYQSSTAPVLPGQPTGGSRLCLSCHDGTIAIGAVASSPTEIEMTQRFLDSGSSALGTDLSDDHPISFVYDSTINTSNPEYKDPGLLIDQVQLDRNGEMQCTSCHDPHDNEFGKFLVEDNTGSAICTECHQPTGWTATPHDLSTAGWNGNGADPWPHTTYTTVEDNGCENCHRPHTAGRHERILNFSAEEENCLRCHDGNVASTDVQSELSKLSSHPVANTLGVHDPLENPATMNRHVECVDCHNPHQANGQTATAPNVSGALQGVTGVNISGLKVTPASYQYEICFKCHGDTDPGPPPVTRQIQEVNKRLQFDLTSPSYHPVEGAGVNTNVPTLIAPYTPTTIIYCTDCHNNDSGPGGGGNGPAGPHGSQWPYLLEREYDLADNTLETPSTYALCYKCHNRTLLLQTPSPDGFPHDTHVLPGTNNNGNAPCSICHDPHGISNSLGNGTNNAHLINFDTTIVTPDPGSGKLEYDSLGTFHVECYLSCHNYDHSPSSY
ncbi:MAG: hypothetical protein GXP58_03300 [Deltaproteobacteria bacterium]|nr:hypothetical protein [Deltaproteobacteria bacterium]